MISINSPLVTVDVPFASLSHAYHRSIQRLWQDWIVTNLKKDLECLKNVHLSGRCFHLAFRPALPETGGSFRYRICRLPGGQRIAFDA